MPHLFEPFYTTKKNGTGIASASWARYSHQKTIDVDYSVSPIEYIVTDGLTIDLFTGYHSSEIKLPPEITRIMGDDMVSA